MLSLVCLLNLSEATWRIACGVTDYLIMLSLAIIGEAAVSSSNITKITASIGIVYVNILEMVVTLGGKNVRTVLHHVCVATCQAVT